MAASSETPVVTCFLRHRGEVLLLRRSADVGSYAGQWGAIAGHAEGNPDTAAWAEIEEESGLHDAATLVRRGEPFDVHDADLETRWVVHPYLFDCARRDASVNWETAEAAWVCPTAILRRDTVPQLWTSYARVAPTVDSIARDHEHGSAYISIRALEVLRDRAGTYATATAAANDPAEALRHLARDLLAARPSMAALRNRVNFVMDQTAPEHDASAVEDAAHAAVACALQADAGTAEHAAGYIADRRVMTLSRSGTVLDALRRADPPPRRVFVAESRPDGEGVYVAETLAEAGLAVTLCTDAGVATLLSDDAVDVVLVGADTVLANGDLVNKTGTRMAALAAKHACVPLYTTMATDKVATHDTSQLEEGPPDALYSGEAALDIHNPTFDVTPAGLISGYITEQGILHASEVRDLAFELEGWTRWQDEEAPPL